MADLLRSLNQDQTQAKKLLDSAEADLDAERFDAAETKLTAISKSGVEFDWLNQQRVDAAQAKITEANAPAAAPAPAPAVAPVAQRPARPATPVAQTRPTAPATPSNNLVSQAQKAVAADYLREAQEAQAQGYDALAINLLTKAEELDPNNPQVQASLAAANNGGTVTGGRPATRQRSRPLPHHPRLDQSRLRRSDEQRPDQAQQRRLRRGRQ